MLKYRLEFKKSRLLLVFQILTYVLLVLSVINWQAEIIAYQFFLQFLVILAITFYIYRVIYLSIHQTQISVIFSQQGDWLETHKDGQTSWCITNQSRVCSLLLFIHLVSPLNKQKSRWRLVFKDQVTELNFRRLCRAIIFQQQSII